MNYYAVRITLPKDDPKMLELTQSLSKKQNILKALICYEAPDMGCNKPHHHLYLKTPLQESATRALFKKYGKGNEFYSLKFIEDTPDDRLNSLKYICKGLSPQIEPIITLNKYPYNTQELHKLYWETNALLKENANPSSKAINSHVPKPLRIYNKIIKKLIKMDSNPTPFQVSYLILNDYYDNSLSPPAFANMSALTDYVLLRYLIEHKNQKKESVLEEYCQRKYFPHQEQNAINDTFIDDSDSDD